MRGLRGGTPEQIANGSQLGEFAEGVYEPYPPVRHHVAGPELITTPAAHLPQIPSSMRRSAPGGGERLNALDYHHISSVSVGRDDAYIVSSRNLDTIWALARNGSGALWTLSSSMNRSDFAFERPIDKFYQARPRAPRASSSSRQRLNTKIRQKLNSRLSSLSSPRLV